MLAEAAMRFSICMNKGMEKFRPFALNPDQVEAFVVYLHDAQPDEAA